MLFFIVVPPTAGNSGRQKDRRNMDGHTRVIYKQKRKAALIGVLSLGLAGLALFGMGNIWRNNIFEGMSFAQGEMKGFFKILSFFFFSVLIAVPFFFISFFKLIYYTILLA
jgi:hypothetical protein